MTREECEEIMTEIKVVRAVAAELKDDDARRDVDEACDMCAFAIHRLLETL